MQASLMGASLESYVIDNEMLGAILRSVRGIEVSDETLSVDIIDQTVRGEGHFLGAADTLRRMTSEFHYPALSDRASHEEWEATGRATLNQRAHAQVETLLAEHFPQHVSTETQARLRQRFDIRLPEASMRPQLAPPSAPQSVSTDPTIDPPIQQTA